MIKPITISVRIAAILGNCVLTMLNAPIKAAGEIGAILSGEVITPIANQVETLNKRLGQVA